MSTVLHVALFAFLAHVTPILRTPVYEPQPDVELSLAPPDTRLSEVPLAGSARSASHAVSADQPLTLRPGNSFAPPRSVRETPARVPTRPTPVPPRPVVSRPVPQPPAPPRQAQRQTPAAPSATAALPGVGARPGLNPGGGVAAGGHGGAGPLPGDEARDGVNAFLRATVGCSHEDYLHLNAAERAACNQRVGRDARAVANAKLDAIPSDKRSYYDAVQQAYQALHDPRAPVQTGTGGQGWSASAAGRPLSFGCKDGKCGINAPQGVLTEESGLPKN